MSRAARLAAFELADIQARESLALLFELKDAGSWHTARCIPAGRCTCDRTTTPPTQGSAR